MKWFSGSIPEAVAEAKRNKKLFLVYIEGTDDMSKTMTSSYENEMISQKLSTDEIIALKLVANSVPYVQFCAIYPVIIIPSSYFIGVNGAPIEIVTGSLGPTEFAEKIDKIIEIYKKSLPAVKDASVAQPSTSKASEPVPIKTENTESSNEPSTSQPSNDAENKAPLEDRVERAKALLEIKKQLQECEEAEKEKKLELERRSVGRALQKKHKEQKDKELQEWALDRAKEKEEERLAREKVKALIAQDRAERAARYQRVKDAENQQQETDKSFKIKEEQERAARSAAMNSDEARIQFRLPDGSSATHIFSADSSLNDARNFVKNDVRPPFSQFSLCTTFPRRHFTQPDYSQTLRDLQLAPSAVLLILPDQSVTHSSSGGFWSTVMWTLLSPLIYSWRTITSFLSGIFQRPDEPTPTPPPPRSESPKRQNEPVRSQSADGVRRRDGRFLRQDGNIYRLNNQSDDDDAENNTWNGNSTQQM